MNLSKNMLLPMGLALLVGACSPFYSQPHPNDPAMRSQKPNPQTLTPEQQQLLKQSQARTQSQTYNPAPDQGVNAGLTPSGSTLTPSASSGLKSPSEPPTNVSRVKKNYPTAAPVPGKDGFVFNPYTHNIVDVKGIASGKLCRDPEDPDSSHKFRVP